MKRFIPPFYLTEEVSRLSGMCLVWGVLLSAICLMGIPAYSQDVLWGLTSGYGPGGSGTAFSLKSTGTDFTVHKAFSDLSVSPTGSLIECSNGNLYGMTYKGGTYGSGTIFKIAPDSTGFITLKSFNGTDGAFPYGSLIEDSNGNLYGMTSRGGAYTNGTIFKLSSDSTGFTVLHSFNGTDGALPHGSLIQGSNGNLYGMTSGGGADDSGTIFKLSPNGTGFTVLHSFNGTDGATPHGSLMEDSNGNLYGTTSEGGDDDSGTIFKLSPNGTGFTVLHSFNGTDGALPHGSLIQGSNGNLYGTTSEGGDDHLGTIFKIAPDGTGFTILISFYYIITNEELQYKVYPLGAYPRGDLIEGSNGNLYGMTSVGSFSEAGTIFKLSPTSFNTLQRFHINGTDGANPYGSLIEGRDGNLYGMTSGGGADDSGTIFKLSPEGTGFTSLHSFSNDFYGARTPSGSLIEGSNGNLYGMTNRGGADDRGTIFKLSPEGTGFTILKSFNGTDGAFPYGSLIEGRDGNLYGMTPEGGDDGLGTIFKLGADGTGFTILKSFDGTDGAYPRGDLIEGSNGNLYGMTSGGGAYDSGTIFKLSPEGTGFTILHSFSNYFYEARTPYGSLIEGSNGNLYGMTNGDGWYYDAGCDCFDGYGTIFKLSPDGTGFTILKSFNGTDGALPYGSLIEDRDGNLYGMTNGDGINQAGAIFKLSPDGTSFTFLHSFNPITDGAFPQGSLIIQKGKKPTVPALQVNFQNKYTQTPQGWLKDYGLPFAEKQVADSSLTYGWKRRDTAEPINLSVGGNFPGNEGNGRWRPAPADPLLATLLHMQGNHVKNFRGTPVESYWELAVENGDYQVTVSVGDGYRYTYSDPEAHSINIEGIPAITHFVPQGGNGSLTRFKQAVVKVTVSDGLLTIDADGGTNTKINNAIIQPLSSSAPIARKDFSAQGTESQAQLSAYPNPFTTGINLTMEGLQGNVDISLYDLTGHTLYQIRQRNTGPTLFVDLSAARLKPAMYLLRLTMQDGSSKFLKVWKR